MASVLSSPRPHLHLPFTSQTQCPPSPFSPDASRSTSGPRLPFAISQQQVPLPSPLPLPNTHKVLVLLRDGAARCGTWQPLQSYRQGAGAVGQLLQVRLAQLCAEQQTQGQESGPCQDTTRTISLVTPPPDAISPPAFCPWCDLTGRGQHALVVTPSNPHLVGLITLLVMIHSWP